jgi:hypothetical protein
VSVQTVRWGYTVFAIDPRRPQFTERRLAWSPNWPRSTALRVAKQFVTMGHETWIVVGRWTLEAGWSFARVDVPAQVGEMPRHPRHPQERRWRRAQLSVVP